MTAKPPLLLYLTVTGDPQRAAVGPALAAAAERAGWGFEAYHAERRRGRHFGGGDPAAAGAGAAAGGLVAGGRHAERLLWLAASWRIVAVGAPESFLWWVVEAAGGEVLARTSRPAELYRAAFGALEQPVPGLAAVIDARPQRQSGVVVGPYLYPALLGGAPRLLEGNCVAVDMATDARARAELEELGVSTFVPLGVDSDRGRAFPGGLDAADPVPPAASYAELTSGLAEAASAWGRGVLLGDPELVAAQLPKARRRRLVPLYGQPQVDVIARAERLVRSADDPVYGRQFDDRDFFSLARCGRGLQVLDPGPPFDAAHAIRVPLPAPPCSLAATEPSDRQLEVWAEEGRVLASLAFWCGMVRELDALPAVIDLVAEAGLRAGLVVTADVLEHAAGSTLELLGVPPSQGGAFGLLEPLLGSTGRGVAAEAELPTGELNRLLAGATARVRELLPAELRPRGWWPLLDAPLGSVRVAPVELRGYRPTFRFESRGATSPEASTRADSGRPPAAADLRARLGAVVRRARLDGLFEARRPYDGYRPTEISSDVAEAVMSAGFEFMLTKARFGEAQVALRRGEFVAVPSTAGRWGGWSPFYSVEGRGEASRAERRLRGRGRPGWLLSTVDTPLWALSGEVWQHGSRLYELAAFLARGGRSGELVNVTPNVVARYARLLDDMQAGREGRAPRSSATGAQG